MFGLYIVEMTGGLWIGMQYSRKTYLQYKATGMAGQPIHWVTERPDFIGVN